MKNPRRRQGTMSVDMNKLAQFGGLTALLTIGLSAVIGAAFRVNVAANWNEQRCDSYVVPIAGFFKPAADPRTAAQFATDNWIFCQKEYVQNALRVAAEAPAALANAEAASVGIVQDIASTAADVFFDLWKFCYETYSSFMDQMKVMGKLFHNFMINIYGITQRLNAATLSIIYGLIGLIVTVINSIQVTLIVAIIVVGIILVLQIILFFVLMPISGLIVTVTALVSVVVVSVATAIAAATVAELFTPGACFAKGTQVQLADGTSRPIESVRLGDKLSDGGYVTAVHTFRSYDTLYNLGGVYVTGDHLVMHSTGRIHVSDHPAAVKQSDISWLAKELWCLTTTTRCIPCGSLMFADWEEIPETDMKGLQSWFRHVWLTLNGSIFKGRPVPHILDSEAGLSPDCLVQCADWLGRRITKPIRNVRIGDRVFDGPTSTTTVIGKVAIAGDQSTNAVEMPGENGVQLVSCATWVRQGFMWKPANGTLREVHPVFWEHLYTQSGQFLLDGDHLVRDASDVGLERLRTLVDSIVLRPVESEHT